MKSKKRDFKLIPATILFVDLIESSEFANILEAEDYDERLEDFRSTVRNIMEEETNKDGVADEFKEISVKGDEGCLILYRAFDKKLLKTEDVKDIIIGDVLLAFKVALRIKQEWLFNNVNIERMGLYKQLWDIAIGINTGKVVVRKHPSRKDRGNKKSAEGYAINLAKRIEDESRKGHSSKIFVSEHIYGIYESKSGEDTLYFKINPPSLLKGIAQQVRTYELVCATIAEHDHILKIPDSIFNNKRRQKKIELIKKSFLGSSNTWLGIILCNMLWKERKYGEAGAIARRLVTIDPSYPPWKLILAQILLDRIEAKDIHSNSLRIEAKELFKEAIKLRPDLVDAYKDMGRLYLDEGRGKRALKEFTIALRLDKKYAILHYYKACALSLLLQDKATENAKAKIFTCLNKAVELEPKSIMYIKKNKDTYFSKIKNSVRFKKIIQEKC